MNFEYHRNHAAHRTPRTGRIAALSLALLGAVMTAPAAAQTCRPTIESTAPDSRYDINGSEGTVYDNVTGLTWMRCVVGKTGRGCSGVATTMNWQTALQYTRDLNAGGGYAGETNWRVPNTKELGSLIERRCFSPAVNANVFPGMPSNFYLWSSTQNHFDTGTAGLSYAWSMHLYDGNDYRKPKINAYPYILMLVRDSQ